MYIWAINCPIYLSYQTENDYDKTLNDILKNSYNKLGIGGKIFFPSIKKNFPRNDNLVKYVKNQIKLFNTNFVGFAFEMVPIDKFSYIINKDNDYEIEEYYVFTKIY